MDELSAKRLGELVSKEPAALNEDEVAFLRARRSYLNEEQLAVFDEVLGGENAERPLERFSKVELQQLADSLGVDSSDLNKNELIAAIRDKQNENSSQ